MEQTMQYIKSNSKKYEMDLKSIIFFFEHFQKDNEKWNKIMPDKYKYLSEMEPEDIKKILDELQKTGIYDYKIESNYSKLFISLYNKNEAIDYLLYESEINNIPYLYNKLNPAKEIVSKKNIQDTEECVKIFSIFKKLSDNFKIFNFIKSLNEEQIMRFINYSKIYKSIIKLDRDLI